MKLGKGKAARAPKRPVYQPIDRGGLLGLLDQVVNGGQSGVLELREPRGTWAYAFQGGALTHASGGRVRGARQAFDLLWEFQSGEFMFTPGVNPALAGNLYIDKNRLLDLLRRSQAVLHGPSAPYIPPDQQRPIAPVQRPYSPPSAAQMPPQWQPGPPGQPPVQGPPPGWPTAQPGGAPVPAWGAGYPQPPGYPAAPYPAPPYGPGAPPQGQPYQPQPYPPMPAGMRLPTGAPAPAYPPPYPQQPPTPQVAPPQGWPQSGQQPPLSAPPPAPSMPAPARPVTPPSFSVPQTAIPKKRESVPTYQPPAVAPTLPAVEPPKPTPPKDDLAALRASLVAQAPPLPAPPVAPTWGVRTAEGTVAPPTPVTTKASKGREKGKSKVKGDSKLGAAIRLQLIKFLLWACERKYSPDDKWTLKDAFEVSTMELRDQFVGAFAQSFKASKKSRGDDDMDDMAAGRMRGRARRR